MANKNRGAFDAIGNKKNPSGMMDVMAAHFITAGDKASLVAFEKKVEGLGIKVSGEQKKQLVSFVYEMLLRDRVAMLMAYCQSHKEGRNK